MEEGYSICLNKWALDKDIKSELGLLLIISSLCAEKGYCYASNEYLAKIFGVTEISISAKLKKLKDIGYITISYEKRGCEIISREIRLKNFLTDDYKKIKSTIKENFKENNISNNNISINNIYIDVINYLNKKANKQYRYDTNKTRSLIKARLNENFTLDDFKKVIDNKCKEWLGTDFEKFLRPETLFGNKFEGYLNQTTKSKEEVPEWFNNKIIDNNTSKEEWNDILNTFS